ncbi:uncharacterized protein N7446_014179 [Penicillium canescens]|uniref:uncharacterized protein n=1 Tax=Penicillium canescens TaxID=5083 RepID=UPI0026DF24CD|nr:uncharacterized protein N7446_014179 [Penicillium canescens]KAJ6038899.1 hypothetical protein N7446_014179 [Penicillium canescens]
MKPKAWVYRFPIPQRYRNVIGSIFELVMTESEYYELADPLLSGLTATEISLIAHLLGVTEQFLYASRYLNPLREQDPFMVYFEPLIKKGLQVLILGSDILDLMERIQRPATYWGSRIAEVETNGGLIHTPEIWIVAIRPNQPTYEAPTELAASEEPFDALVQPVESKYMYRDPDTSMPVMWLKGTGVYLRHRHPQMETQRSKYMCTVESSSFAIDWDDLYQDIRPGSTLPYIDASGEPHTIKFSEHDTAMEYKSDTHNEDRSVVLWKRMYGPEANAVFNGRVLDRNGRNILGEVEFAFKFPFQSNI